MEEMKKTIMVHYKLLPSDEYDNVSHTVRCWHLRLTRLKVFGFIVTALLTFAIVMTAFIHSRPWTHMTLSDTSCLDATDKDKKNQALPSSPFYKQRLPSAIIIGVRKAGTRALLQFISLHQGIVIANKETHFFDRYYDRGFDWYLRQMPSSFPHQITVEKTPSYFVDGEIPEKIHRYNASIKLLLIVRNPVDRSMSDYLQLKDNKINNLSENKLRPFEEIVVDKDTGRVFKTQSFIRRSVYIKHLKKWLKYFPLDQMLILDGENIKVKPWEEMTKVQRFLGLPEGINKSSFIYNKTKGFFCMRTEYNSSITLTEKRTLYYDNISNITYLQTCLAKSKGREHPEIEPEVRMKLVKYFKPFNERFFDLIGQRFNWN